MKHDWIITGLVAVVAILATIVVSDALDQREAHAQISGATADYLVGIVGQKQASRSPLFLIDSKSQTIMIYEYDQSIRKFWLRAARNFQYDRRLEDKDFSSMQQNRGPSVRDIRKIVGNK
jgi:hypothetical protein